MQAVRGLCLVKLLSISVVAINSYAFDLPGAEKDRDQSLVWSIGKTSLSDNGKETMYRIKYAHKISQRLMMSIKADHVSGPLSRTELLIGIQVYPVKVPLYFNIEAGAKAKNNNLVIGVGAGYEYTLLRQWFIDINSGIDWDDIGNERRTVVIGLGKRF